MVHTGALSLHVVTTSKPKRLRGWSQKARGQVQGLLTPLTQMAHHRRRGETYPTRVLTGNVVSLYLTLEGLQGKRPARGAEGVQVGESGGSEGRSVTERIGVGSYDKITPRETEQTSAWC
mgnify:CR=1 FL=1